MFGNGSKIAGTTITTAHLQMGGHGEKRTGHCGGRVLRGGSWSFGPGPLRSSNRNWRNAGFRNDDIGFRLAQDLN